MTKKLILICCCFIFASLLFADTQSSDATLTVKGYKEADTPSEGTLKVYIYDTRSRTSSTTQVSDELDITSYVKSNNYISGFKDVFRIYLQSNLNKKVTVSIAFSPFVSDSEKQDIIPTAYYMSLNAGTYESSDYSYSYSYSTGSYTQYKYQYATTLTVSNEDFSDSTSGCVVGSGGKKETIAVSVLQEVTTKQRKTQGGRGGSSYTDFTPTEYVLDGMTSSSGYYGSSSSTLNSTIYVKMKLVPTEAQKTAHSSTSGITPNVEYTAPVTITVSIE